MLEKKTTATDRGKRSKHTCITSPELQDALLHKAVPHLGLRDLAALASTCTTLCNLAYHSSAWCSTAAAFLPPLHPAPTLSQLDRTGVQQVMQRRAKARKRLSPETTACALNCPDDEGQVEQVKFSACGTRLAVVSEYFVSVFSVSEGTFLWRKSMASLKQDSWQSSNTMNRHPLIAQP
ncbi:hypothetical protein WJX73_004436 [Symbiochloris irregularis]|uniref:F-box domain-containing protein n=1 Tax=Symbiochloris irregularis TaxID=706552 RepID=A0AAW1P0S8_9CHLO